MFFLSPEGSSQRTWLTSSDVAFILRAHATYQIIPDYPVFSLASEGNLARLEESARMRQKLVEMHHCVSYARITHAGDDALATTSRTPGTPKCAFRRKYPSSSSKFSPINMTN